MPRQSGVSCPDIVAFIVVVTPQDKVRQDLCNISFPSPSLYSVDEYRCRCSYMVKCADIKQMMIESGLRGFISPLHLPEGDDTQWHFHVMIVRPLRQGFSMKTWRYLAGSMGALNSYVVPLERPHNYALYLVHGRQEDSLKTQYTKNSVISIGLDYESYSSIHDSRYDIATDATNILSDVLSFIRSNHVIFFADLVDYTLEKCPDWLPCIRSNRALISDYLRSEEYKLKHALKYEERHI